MITSNNAINENLSIDLNLNLIVLTKRAKPSHIPHIRQSRESVNASNNNADIDTTIDIGTRRKNSAGGIMNMLGKTNATYGDISELTTDTIIRYERFSKSRIGVRISNPRNITTSPLAYQLEQGQPLQALMKDFCLSLPLQI